MKVKYTKNKFKLPDLRTLANKKAQKPIVSSQTKTLVGKTVKQIHDAKPGFIAKAKASAANWLGNKDNQAMIAKSIVSSFNAWWIQNLVLDIIGQLGKAIPTPMVRVMVYVLCEVVWYASQGKRVKLDALEIIKGPIIGFIVEKIGQMFFNPVDMKGAVSPLVALALGNRPSKELNTCIQVASGAITGKVKEAAAVTLLKKVMQKGVDKGAEKLSPNVERKTIHA